MTWTHLSLTINKTKNKQKTFLVLSGKEMSSMASSFPLEKPSIVVSAFEFCVGEIPWFGFGFLYLASFVRAIHFPCISSAACYSPERARLHSYLLLLMIAIEVVWSPRLLVKCSCTHSCVCAVVCTCRFETCVCLDALWWRWSHVTLLRWLTWIPVTLSICGHTWNRNNVHNADAVTILLLIQAVGVLYLVSCIFFFLIASETESF